MYDTGKKGYLLKQSDGRLYHFYHSGKAGVAVSLLQRSGGWSDPELIYGTADGSFHAAVGRDDRFHLLAGSDNGGLTYVRHSDGRSAIVPVLESRNRNIYDKYPTVIPSGEGAHFFYVLRHGNSRILSHQYYSDASGMAGNPRVVDFVCQGARPYCVAAQNGSNGAGGGLTAVYVSPSSDDSSRFSLMLKKYTPSSGSWGDAIPLDRDDILNSPPAAVKFGDDSLLLCYQKRAGDEYSLVFARAGTGAAPKTIHRSSMPFEGYNMLMAGRSLIIFWIRDENIYYSASDDMGAVWSRYSKYIFADGRPFSCFGYASNERSGQEPAFSAAEAPGIARPLPRIAFLGRLTPSSAAPQEKSAVSGDGRTDAESQDGRLKSLIIDTLTLCRNEISDLRRVVADLNDEIVKLKYSHDETVKDIARLQYRPPGSTAAAAVEEDEDVIAEISE